MPDETTPPTKAPARAVERSFHPAGSLRTVRVDYPHRPDRCTIRPRDVERPAVATTWLAADAHAFVDLDAVR